MKKCSKCKETKSLSEFNKQSSKRDGVQARCRACQAAGHQQYYRDNKIEWQARQADMRNQLRIIANEAKNQPCADCGNVYPSYVMDFDHREPDQKRGNISLMVTSCNSKRILLEEIAKCEVVCSNCHRERTFGSHGGSG